MLLLPLYPADGEVFELTLDGGAPRNQPLEMVRRDHYSDWSRWRHNGPKVESCETRCFKLVSVGYCRDFSELTGRLKKCGAIPPGQWREALKAAYGSDGKGPVGIADSSWIHPDWICPDGLACFPCVGRDGRPHFYCNAYNPSFGGEFRWLVEVSK